MSITTGQCEAFKFDKFSKIITVLLLGERLSGLQPANTETSSHHDPAAFIKIGDIKKTFYENEKNIYHSYRCLLYTSPSPRDGLLSRMPSSA